MVWSSVSGGRSEIGIAGSAETLEDPNTPSLRVRRVMFSFSTTSQRGCLDRGRSDLTLAMRWILYPNMISIQVGTVGSARPRLVISDSFPSRTSLGLRPWYTYL